MPKRPSKKVRVSVKPGALKEGQTKDDQRSKERRSQLLTRATLGKFQGRQSI